MNDSRPADDRAVHAVCVAINAAGLVLCIAAWRVTGAAEFGLGVGWCVLWGAAHTANLRKILRKGVRL